MEFPLTTPVPVLCFIGGAHAGMVWINIENGELGKSLINTPEWSNTFGPDCSSLLFLLKYSLIHLQKMYMLCRKKLYNFYLFIYICLFIYFLWWKKYTKHSNNTPAAKNITFLCVRRFLNGIIPELGLKVLWVMSGRNKVGHFRHYHTLFVCCSIPSMQFREGYLTLWFTGLTQVDNWLVQKNDNISTYGCPIWMKQNLICSWRNGLSTP